MKCNSKLKAMRAKCDAINKTLSGYPTEEERERFCHMEFKQGVASRWYRNKKVFMCTECGCEVHVLTQHECPQCHAKWDADGVIAFNINENWRKKLVQEKAHYEQRHIAVFEAIDGLQLCRYYRVEKRIEFGKKASIHVWEIMRFFYFPDGERVMYQCAVGGMYVSDAFSYESNLYFRYEHCKNDPDYNYEYDGAIDRANYYVDKWVIKSLTKEWSYKPIEKLLNDCNGHTGAIRLIAYPYGETLIKSGQVDIFSYLMDNNMKITDDLKKLVNICNRHHYIVHDVSLWVDTLKYLKQQKKDIHNPKYVCPQDLRALHQQLLNRQHRIDEAARARRKAEEAQKEARMMKDWAAHFDKMLSLELDSTNLHIRPLQSIQEFEEEGEHMHHCVYSMHYWDYRKNPNTLILSAKDDDGNRLATIEYNMGTNKVIQCRAACNKVPPRYDEIVNFILNNKSKFVELEKFVGKEEKKTEPAKAMPIAA